MTYSKGRLTFKKPVNSSKEVALHHLEFPPSLALYPHWHLFSKFGFQKNRSLNIV